MVSRCPDQRNLCTIFDLIPQKYGRKRTSVYPMRLRLLRTFAGVLPCPPGKNSYARHFKGKHGKLYIVGKLSKCRFWKKYELPVFIIPHKKIAKMTAKMTMRHSIKQMN